ncbi:MAG: hypothetical protein ACXWCZ_11880, partial [Flavisolibacter sp.]
LKNTIVNLIQTKLSFSLYRLLAYYKAASTAPLEYLTTGSFNNWKILNKKVVDATEIIAVGLSSNWWLVKNNSTTINYEWLSKNKEKILNADAILATVNNWTEYYNSIPPDESIFSSALADAAPTPDEQEYLRIQHAANHNLFSSIFDQYLFAFTKITKEASTELERTLTNWDGHQPHYALFLSFLKLFKYAQEQSNTITKRHLDFYYKEVLRLKPKDALPNKAHILVELAKQIDSYLLAKGVQLKAGKDSIGKDVIYALDIDSTFNKAKITSLSSVYIGNVKDAIESIEVSPPVVVQNNLNRMFASPIGNSQDGLGAELTSASKEWHPYVHKEFQDTRLVEIAMPKATIGFAIASHYLYLTEGNREVNIKLVTSANNTLLNKKIECYLTTAKGWHKVASPVISISTLVSPGSAACAQISFTLTGDLPAIENYNPAIHGGSFDSILPILKVHLKHDDLIAYEYEQLKNITITKVEVQVKVGMDAVYSQRGLKNLLLSNDAGVLDASKPFMPFGPHPNKDAAFVIGNKEIFSKKNVDVKVNIEWANHPGANSTVIDYETQVTATLNASTGVVTYTPNPEGTLAPKVYVSYLASGTWNQPTEKEFFLNPTIQVGAIIPSIIPEIFFEDYNVDYLPFNSKSNRGFIRFTLER